MTDITKDQFWGVLNEPEPEIAFNSYNYKVYSWYNENGQLHRDNDLPARIWYYRNGNSQQKIWYRNGKRHRVDGPAEIWYDRKGNIEEKCWYLNGTYYPQAQYQEKLKELGHE